MKKKRLCYPDFLVEFKDGRKFVVELKAWYGPQAKAKFRAASKWCAKNNYEWAVIFEKPIQPLTEYLQ
jgi:hypothetical protein